MIFWFIVGIVLGSATTYAVVYIHRERVYAGNIVLSETEEGKKIFSLEIEKDPDDIWVADVISFKVVPSRGVNENRE